MGPQRDKPAPVSVGSKQLLSGPHTNLAGDETDAVTAPNQDDPVADPTAPVVYSFGQSAHLTAEKTALYQEAADQIAFDVAVGLADWLTGFSVQADPLIEAGAGHELVDVIDDYDEASILLNAQGAGTLSTELPLALALVTGLLGGSSMPAGDPRPLTSIERRVLDLVLQTVIQAAAKTLLIRGDMVVDRSRNGAFAANEHDNPEARIGFAFRIQGPGGGGQVVVGLELWALQDFSDVIDGRLTGRRTVMPVSADPHTAAALQPVPIPLSIGLERVHLTAREVVGLRKGDVIRTRHAVDADAIASVGNVDLFVVRLGQSGRRLTAEVIAPLGKGYHSFAKAGAQ